MTNFGEKLCLQWNDFRENVSSAFGDLREDKEFTDVTLACEDGQQVEAHKVVLIASSPFFLNILKRNKHSHPLIYMRGVKSENLTAMVDFFYHGKSNVSKVKSLWGRYLRVFSKCHCHCHCLCLCICLCH